MATTDAEHPPFICHHCAAKLRDVERVVKGYLVGVLAVNVPEVDRLAAPLKVVHEFVGTVALLQDERVLQQFAELIDHVHFGIVSDAAVQLS